MMRNLRKQILQGIVVLLGSIITGFFLLLLVYLIPQEKLDFNTEISLRILLEQGGGKPVLERLPETEADYFTDAVMVNTTYTAEGNLLDQVLLAQGAWDGLPAEELQTYFQADDETRSKMELRNYARYWHGYQVILRPLLMHFHINQIRMIGMIAMISLIFILIWLVCKTGNGQILPPLFALSIFLVPVIVLVNLQYYACIFTTLFAMCALLILQKQEINVEHYLYLVMECSGICIGYLDLLTFPSISLGIPLILFYYLDREAGRTYRERLFQFLEASGAWVMGYGGMLAGKWILATSFTRENIIADGINTVMQRSSGAWKGEKISYLEVLQKNFGYYDSSIYKTLLLALLLLFIGLLLHNGKPQWHKDADFGIGLCFLIPLGWFMLTRNHSIIHSHYTFRTFSTMLFGSCMLVYESLPSVHRIPANLSG